MPETATESTAETTTERTTDESVDYTLLPATSTAKTPTEVQNSLRAVDCSTLSDSTVVCPDDDARLAVSRSASVQSLPRDTIAVTVRNDSDERFAWNPYGWELPKYDGGAWRHIAPLAVRGSLDGLAPGESHTDSDPDATLLPEHVLQIAGLRNTLPYAPTEGVDAIRDVTSENAVDTALTYLRAAGSVDAAAFGFRDYVFEASKGSPA